MSISAEYLARADLRLGAISARHHPDLRARFGDVARMLGSDDVWVRAQWSALAQLAALHGVRPHDLTTEQVDAGGDALLTAFAHPAHPKAGPVLRSSLVRLRATLFHAGMSDTPPRLHRPNTGQASASQWATVSPVLAQTVHRYLAQIELSLRPSTVRIAEQTLRELATFVTREAPEVRCVADIGRHHIEAPGSDGINGVRLANAIHLSSWLGQEVPLDFDEDRYLRELNTRIRQEGKFPERQA